MKTVLTKEEIGKRLCTLRTKKSFSQEELATAIGLSRTAIVQVENGNRGLEVTELQKISLVLGFSLDSFFAADFNQKDVFFESNLSPEEPVLLRISVPELNLEKFKNVLLYILECCAGRPNMGETVLNKLLYFSDFNYYELYEEHLTGAQYRKLPFGPVPQRMDVILENMVETGEIERVKTAFKGFPQTRYLPLVEPDLKKMSAAEKEVIDHVIDSMGSWSATRISEYSHKDVPWQATPEGEFISYNLAFYREMPYSVRSYSAEGD